MNSFNGKNNGLRKLSLAGSWELSNHLGTHQLTATVPGDIPSSLLSKCLIPDPYYRDNDISLRWIAHQNWTYRREFQLSAEFAEAKKVLLVCHCLDTLATVKLNGETVGKADSEFRRWVWNVTNVVRKGENKISIEFADLVEEGERRRNEYKYTVPDGFAPVQNGERNRNFFRKEQCSFSWDWGPCFLPQGIRGDIELIALGSNDVWISHIAPDITLVGNNFIVKTRIFMECAHGVRGCLMTSCVGREAKKEVDLKEGQCCEIIELLIPSDSVKLWWPLSHGTPHLYTLTITFVPHSSYSTTLTREIGFRTVSLEQAPYPNRPGTSFKFVVNGLPIFAKGANFIPTDAFEARVDDEVLRHILQSSADAGMNMVRVWGGGIYQRDIFYDICDKLGLMVWQEFMFACAMYPTNSTFLSSVRDEVSYQIRKLMHHPSIVLWSGNNENEVALTSPWYQEINDNVYQYTADYHKLYVDTILPVVQMEDPTRSFITSSPSQGIVSIDPYMLRYKPEPGIPSFAYGDVHFYNYRDKGTEVWRFPRSRFVSEYGFQSMPSFSNFELVSEEKDWNAQSDLMLLRNHHQFGQEEMIRQLKMFFNLPEHEDCRTRFDHFSYLTQCVQAMIIKAQTEHYRRQQGDIEVDCMGALYWQLNDIWQAPTWAGIEYGGNWKMMHSYAKKFFSPVLLSSFEAENGQYEVHVTNDRLIDIEIIVTIDVFSFSSNSILHTTALPTTRIPAHNSRKVLHADNIEQILDNKTRRTDALLRLTCVCSTTNRILSTNDFYPSSFADVSLLNPHLSIVSVDAVKSTNLHHGVVGRCKVFAITLKCEYAAVFVLLESSASVAGVFSDNGFSIIDTREVVIYFSVSESHVRTRELALAANKKGVRAIAFDEIDRRIVESSLRIRSIWDTIEK